MGGYTKLTATVHSLILGFLIANTVVFALLVYNLESYTAATAAAAVSTAGGVSVCRCPLNNGDTRTCMKVFEMIEGVGVGKRRVYGPPPPTAAVAVARGFDVDGGGEGGMAGKGWIGDDYEGFERLRMWKMCVEEVEAVREWRDWVIWVLMPLQCLVEVVVGWGWWLCLVEEEKMEEEERRKKEEEAGKYEEEVQLNVA
ncbi:hypothetical protein AA313_de0206662 [Arthrobotrys entomopaga]|nr:hypothetical protein AA313_de0206662 [Arthrobotrys entomopaga]